MPRTPEVGKEIAERFMVNSRRSRPPFLPDPKDAVALAQAYLELEAAFRDELDNWNPERRPTIAAERDGLREALRIEMAGSGFTDAEIDPWRSFAMPRSRIRRRAPL